MPSPYTSGTGFMLVSGLLQMFPFGEPDGWEYLDQLHENTAWYTHKGEEPCDLVAQDDPKIAIGIGAASGCSEGSATYVYPLEGYGWEMDAVALVRKDVINKGAQAFLAWAISER